MKKFLCALTLLAMVILSGCAGYYYEGGAYEVYPRPHHRAYYNERPAHYRGNYYSSGSQAVYPQAPNVRVVGGGGYRSN